MNCDWINDRSQESTRHRVLTVVVTLTLACHATNVTLDLPWFCFLAVGLLGLDFFLVLGVGVGFLRTPLMAHPPGKISRRDTNQSNNEHRPAPFKALFSLDPDNLQLHCFLRLGALFCCSFFCPLNQPCKTLQTVQQQVAP